MARFPENSEGEESDEDTDIEYIKGLLGESAERHLDLIKKEEDEARTSRIFGKVLGKIQTDGFEEQKHHRREGNRGDRRVSDN